MHRGKNVNAGRVRKSTRRGEAKRPRVEANDAVAAALHAMEEEAEKEEKTQQHAVAMVLEQSEGEGRGQDPATLCASSWEPEPSNDAEIDAATYAIALTVRATRTLSRSPLS